jgi:hypothetical protein
MERHEILEMMAALKLAGRRAGAACPRAGEARPGGRGRHQRPQAPAPDPGGDRRAAPGPARRQPGALAARGCGVPAPHRSAYRLGKARFPLAKTLAELDFTASPVNAGLVRDLHEGGFLPLQRNPVFCGGTGSGKSHLAICGVRGPQEPRRRDRRRLRAQTAPAPGSSTPSTWSTSSRPKRAWAVPASSPLSSSAAISSSSQAGLWGPRTPRETSSAICRSR